MSEVATIEVFADHLRLRPSASDRGVRFHWFWLRHNCPREVHPLTRERTLDVRRVPLEVVPRSVRLDAGTVHIEWGESGRSGGTAEQRS